MKWLGGLLLVASTSWLIWILGALISAFLFSRRRYHYTYPGASFTDAWVFTTSSGSYVSPGLGWTLIAVSIGVAVVGIVVGARLLFPKRGSG